MLPAFEYRNIRIFYFLSFTRSAVFLNANWIFFWLRLMTYGQLGLIDAASFAFGLVMEIPTGAISDMIGKRFTLVLAGLFTGLGFLVMGFAENITGLIVGFWICQIGWAFFSGADEAMAYDTLKENHVESRYGEVISRSNSMGLIVLIISTLIGGFMYQIDVRMPHYAWAILLLLGGVAAYFIQEPHIEREHFTLKGYFGQLSRGFIQLSQPKLLPLLPLIFGISGAGYLFGYGLVQPAVATQFGFYADEQSVVFSAILALIAVFMLFVPALQARVSNVAMLIVLAVGMALGFVGASLPIGMMGGFLVLLLIRATSGIAQLWNSTLINQHIPSEDRATTLSTVALLVKLPYVLTAVIAGQMTQDGHLGWFTFGVGVFLLVMMSISLIALERRKLEFTVEKRAEVQ